MTIDRRFQDGDIPVACLLAGAAERAARAAEVAALLGRAAQVERLPSATRYVFSDDVALVEAVLRFVAQERSCCPFLGFSVSLPPGGPLVLEIDEGALPAHQ